MFWCDKLTVFILRQTVKSSEIDRPLAIKPEYPISKFETNSKPEIQIFETWVGCPWIKIRFTV